MAAVTGTLRYALPSDEVGSLATVTVQAGGPAAAGYGVTYLTDFTDLNLGRPCLSTTTQMSLQLDFGVGKANLAAIMLWHNIDAAAVITIKADDTANWASPAFSTTVTALAKRGDGRFKKLIVILGQNRRYFLIQSPTNSVNPGFKAQCYTSYRSLVGIGTNAVGGGQQFLWGTRRPNSQLGIDLATEYDYHWVYDFSTGSESLQGPIALSDADSDSLLFLQQATGGRRLCLFVPDSGSAEAWLTRLAIGPAPYQSPNDLYTSIFDRQMVGPGHNLVQLAVQDMTAGGPEWV